MTGTIGGPSLRRRRGFTLVELLASLAFVAAVLPAAVKGISLATSTAGLTAQQMTALTLADNLLAEVVATQTWRDGAAAGAFEEDPLYEWEIDVTDWQGAAVQQVTVTVSWTYRTLRRQVELSTLVYSENQA